LADIRQAGATNVVQGRQAEVVAARLNWNVVKSMPVHENIKTRTGDFSRHIGNYQQSLRNLAACGIRTVAYNFMPVLDWTRTNLSYEVEDGSKALRFEKAAFVAFDVYLLGRPGAERDYTPTELTRARQRLAGMRDAERHQLARNIVAGRPGAEESFTLPQLQHALDAYTGIDAA
jgi:mannonate dehydratase